MRKKSHISLSRYLIHNMDKRELETHKKAFYIGSILPDCVPSFITRRHTYDETFYIVKNEMNSLIDDFDEEEGIDRKFCRRLGIITHYIADYFTYPHNSIFEGNMKDHCQYENILKHRLKEYIQSHTANQDRAQEVRFTSTEDIFRFISNNHERYLNTIKEIKVDIEYIVNICFQVVDALIRLVELSLENRLIPQSV